MTSGSAPEVLALLICGLGTPTPRVRYEFDEKGGN